MPNTNTAAAARRYIVIGPIPKIGPERCCATNAFSLAMAAATRRRSASGAVSCEYSRETAAFSAGS